MRTEIIFILDASGSMGGLEADTVGGFNSMIQRNLELEGEAKVSTLLFNSGTTVLHDRVDIREVPRLTTAEYRCMGCTALLDALGGAIRHVDMVKKILPASLAPERVLFVVTTDGMENASRRYGYDQVRSMIEKRQEEGWEFLFIGANIDAVQEAGNLGIRQENAANYRADSIGTEVLYASVAEAVCSARMAAPGAAIDSGWRESLDEDMRSRG